jgi:cobalt/nickel transport system permease protein
VTAALWAVHIADGYVGSGPAAVGFLVAATLVGYSLRGINDDEIPRVGVMASAFFVASLIHLPVGASSAHLLLNGLLGVVLGRRAAVAVAVGLFLQAFLFSHGGLSTLGVNVVVYALPALVAGVLFRPVRRRKFLSDFWLGLLFGAATAAATVGLNFLVLMFLGRESWETLAWLVLVANLPVIVVEAVGVGFVTDYLGVVKPEWLD